MAGRSKKRSLQRLSHLLARPRPLRGLQGRVSNRTRLAAAPADEEALRGRRLLRQAERPPDSNVACLWPPPRKGERAATGSAAGALPRLLR